MSSKLNCNLTVLRLARKQLIKDIDAIVEKWECKIVPDISEDDMEDLKGALCDAVCKYFPLSPGPT
tara:strand:- start:246 stop:443 length:198 start_codon:yes stop_codon:yes gene_type:complete